MKAGLLQFTSTDDPTSNLTATRAMMRDAAGQGAEFILTPEVTNCVSVSRRWQQSVLCLEANDPTLAGLRAEAAALGVWLSIGSLALKTDDPDGRFANRSFVINPAGDIVARYDKIHMFDVEVSEKETYRESAGYRPGAWAVTAQTPFGQLGLSICYDLRFAYLFRALAQAGADILLVPSAFSPVTGAAHWQPLLQPARLKRVVMCWPLPKLVITVGAKLTGIAWRFRHGARFCWMRVRQNLLVSLILTRMQCQMRANASRPCRMTAHLKAHNV